MPRTAQTIANLGAAVRAVVIEIGKPVTHH
jgi:hypothetical protein